MSNVAAACDAVGIPARLARWEQFPALASIIDTMGSVGTRLATGFPSLDRALRGGIPGARLVIVGGAPGAAKTMTIAQLALTWAQAGNPVAFLASDEEAAGIMTRWGQAFGFELDKLENGDAETKRELAAKLAALPLRLIDSDHFDDPVTIDEVSAALATAPCPPGKVRALFVDSAQTAKAAGMNDVDSRREKVGLAIAALKRAAKRDGHVAIATSELARGAYRSRSQEDTISEIASYKETGDVEYQAHAAINLRTIDETPGLIEVRWGKNRIGRSADAKAPFRLRIDFVTATLREVEMPPPDRAVGGDSLDDAVIAAIDAADLYSTTGIYEAVRESIGGVRKQKVLDAVRRLKADGAIVQGKDKLFAANRLPTWRDQESLF